MAKVYHPELGTEYDVPKRSLQEWKDAGWRVTKPAAAKSDEPAAEPKKAAAKKA